MQSLSIDVGKLKCIVRLADMMLCGAGVGMLLEGVGGLQARLASQAPLLVEPGFSRDGVCFQPEGPHMLKVCCFTPNKCMVLATQQVCQALEHLLAALRRMTASDNSSSFRFACICQCHALIGQQSFEHPCKFRQICMAAGYVANRELASAYMQGIEAHLF